MKITRHITDDKLTLLSLAGIAPEGGSGWDYAIPQGWANQLQDMGIDNPGRWFAADCTGPCAIPKLHHTGEAWAAILNHRSKMNEEIIISLAETHTTFYEFLVSDEAEVIRAESDVGLLDFNQIHVAWQGGYAQGQKDLLPLVNEGIRVVELHDSHWTDVRDILRKIQHAINQHE